MRNLAVLGGQQLRGDRSVQNVQQHGAQGVGGGNVGFVMHQMAHQRFGHPGVHTVHAHVVAVVGGPAQCQLRQVAGAHHKAAGAVGSVHQFQRAHTGLPIFKGHVQHAFVLADVPEVAVHRLGDVDLFEGDLQLIAQDLGIAAGAVGGAEAGHGHGQHIAGGAAQLLHGAHRHQQGQTAVQTAGNADDRRFGVGVLQPLGQTVGLHLQDQFAALGAALGVAGHEGCRVDPAGEGGLGEFQIKLHRGVTVAAQLKAGVAGTLGLHALAVDLGLGNAARKGSCLGQQGAVFGDQVVPGEHHVLGALAVPGRGVQVAAQQAGRLVGHQCPAVLGLADGLVAGRKVGDDRGPGQRVEGGGRQRTPQVLAQLYAQHKTGHGPAAEQQRSAKGHLLAAHGDRFHLGAAGGKLALLVEFAVVGQVGLGHKAQQLPAAQHGGAVVQLAVYQQRQAHQHDGVQRPGAVQHGLQGIQRTGLQRVLQEQIAAGVAGEAEFREHGQLDPVRGGCLHVGKDLLGVIGAVRHPQGGGEGGCL